jgi:hypothetical protein
MRIVVKIVYRINYLGQHKSILVPTADLLNHQRRGLGLIVSLLCSTERIRLKENPA